MQRPLAFSPGRAAVSRQSAALLIAHAMIMAALFTGFGASAFARDLNDGEVASLKSAVARFDTAMRESNYEVVVDTIPPRVLSHIADQSGLDRAALRTLVVATMKQTLATVKLVSFGMDTDKLDRKQLPDGSPYALIPTATVMDAGNGKISVNSHTLALIDSGSWYLLRISEAQQIEILRKVYPEFAGVVFPSGSIEAMKD